MLLTAAIAVALVSLAAAAHTRLRGRAVREALRVATSRLAVIDADTSPDAVGEDPKVGRQALRRDERVSFAEREGVQDRAVLSHFLADYRDVLGAEEAIFWRWSPDRDLLFPLACSSEAELPVFFDMTEWAPLVQWSAETLVIQTIGHEDVVIVGAVAVQRDDEVIGVLSVTHREGLAMPRPGLKEWLPRLARQLATFQGLVDVRKRYARHMRQGQALLDAVQRLQADMSGEGLARALCETALDVSGARGAALVRWDADADSGELYYATEGTGLRAHAALSSSSVVTEACRSGRLHVLEDARGAASGQLLYGVPRVIREPGSVAIIPITKEGRLLGALVLEADTPGDFTQEEVRPLTVLGAVVAGSLELSWSFLEVDKRARTDPLTGLWNRLHFGEQLERMLAEADRSVHPLALVLIDIDHFKAVNDGFGHEAGDAVLKHVARIVQDGVRQIDVCVRYGGEEIAVLMGHTESVRAEEVAERLRARIAASAVRHGGATINVTASFGVAAYPETVKDREQLFPSADKALYIAKHEGRNCVRAKPPTRGRATS